MNALVKCQRRSLAVILFLGLQLAAAAQLTANFMATPQSGCSPLIVYFSDLSTGNPNQWKWDLGNGAVSTLKNPSATYFNPGTYTIRLVVKNATGADSITKLQYITVHPNPVVNFGASDTSGCFPMNVQFSDSSAAASGSISSWQWDFGDGSISSQQNPSHTYQSSGNYTVTLKVTNSHGCVKSMSKSQYIQVQNGVSASFSYTAPSVCAAPATVQFNNTSTGPGNISYQWSFGDGGSSSTTHPAHTYNSIGNYSVALIATSAQGCTDTVLMNGILNIGTQHADFSAPFTACVGQAISLTNTSSPSPGSVQWNFGDGTTAASMNAVKTFNNPGVYSIRMRASFGSCVDSITKQITIASKPVASFLAGQTVFCKTPATVQFNSTGAGLAHAWDFGDGQTSTLVNPNHTYSAEGNYTVTLIVTNAAGCTDTLIRPSYIQIKEPVIQLTGLPQTGCNPVTANPSANVLSSEPVQTWSWNFGDGNFSNQATPSHTYTTAGNYNVTLVITTASGCKDSVTMVNGVRLGDKPVANFFPQPAIVCNSQPVQFIDSSTGNVDQWHWDFGDNMTSNQQNPAHVFGDVGVYTVTLIASSNTCADTITKVNVVTILPPISAFTVQNSCQDKYVKQFKDASFGATTWLWNFGDGSTSTAQNPSHTYAAPGNYYVTLTVSNGSCWNVNFAWANVIDEKASFNYEDVICKGMADSFSTPAVNPANIASWQWSFGDGTSSNAPAPVVHYYTQPGTYIVSLSLKDILGCVQTSTDTVKVFGPRAIFAPSVSSTCLSGNQVAFTDSSIGDGQNPIQQWQWNFGDGNIFNTASGAALTHHYLTAGQYNIRLVVKDSYGCSDSASFSPLVVAQPVAYFYTTDTLSCTSKNISFINQSTGSGLQYAWNFGDGQSATNDMPVHQYANMGVYDVSLLVTDQYGCKDSMVKTAYVHISVPKAAFSISDSIGTCPPMMVHFTNTASAYIQYAWDFGDGSSSTLLNPSHYYTAAGVYYPKLIVTGPGGCTDTATKKIIVKGPSGSFTYSPKTGCLPLAVNYNLVAENASSFVWDFSDGSTQPSISNQMTHTYTTAGDYIPKLILVDTAGCSVPIIGSDTIHVYGVKTAFSPSIRMLCGAGSIQFFNYTVANDLITSYQWSFGDGTYSTSPAPQHHYQQPGLYSIQLIAVTSNGCRDTATLIDGIKLLEKPDIKISGDSTSCVPATIHLNGQVMNGNASTLGWQWALGNGNTFAGQQPPAQTYAADGNYNISVIVTAPNGCRDTALHSLTVFPLPSTNAGEDRSICRGESIQLSATGASNYIWNQHPSLACTSCATPTVSPAENLVYTVTGTNSFGCSSRDSIMVNVKQPFVLKVGGNDTICLGESVKLAASGADQYSWYPSTGIQNSNMGNTIAIPQQTTTYHVIATDDQHCFTDTAEVYIKVWPLPTVNAGADQELIVGEALQLTSTSSADVTSWQWSQDGTLSCSTCPITLAKPKHTTTYTLKVTNDGGCVAQDHLTVNVICNNGNLFLPNTFSPNGDGMNDRFYPSGKGITMIKSLRVYNRWGQVVYERTGFNANDASMGWDGTFKGEVLPPDVYVYACEVVCQNNEVLSYKGDITLLR